MIVGLLAGGTVFVIWIGGSLRSGRRRAPERHKSVAFVAKPYTDPLPEEEFIPEPGENGGEITRDQALEYMLQGKFGRFSLPGIVQPAAVSAAAAPTRDDAAVVGVGVAGHWRAYCVSEMQTPLTHVINDVIDGMAVTVTYCDANNCARVLTDREMSNRPLDVGVGGFWHDGMLLHIEHQNYSQSSPEVPLYNLEFEMTTWKEWKTAHPQTDVCVEFEPLGYESTAAKALLFRGAADGVRAAADAPTDTPPRSNP